jgi:hypothetical protein
MKGKLFIFTILSVMAVMVLAVSASAGNGNPPNGQGGNPPSGPGNICKPGYHGEPAGSNNCVHNGDGAGNCDQNQSDNTGHGAGNGGNDYGDGHKGDKCEGPKPPPECKGDKCHPQPPPVTPPATTEPCPYPPSGKDGNVPPNGNTNDDCIPPVPTSPVTPVTPLETPCPAGTTRNDQLSRPGLLVCMQLVPGPERVVERTVTKTVFGKPKCPKGTKLVKRGPGFVSCTRTVVKNHIKTVVKVRVVKAAKPAYTK